ncbi:hypothetical protein [Crossiella sp. CA198]|uniref:hypothetical protein n=1 Tax=Crossiella sp. CA198 TaxID=3455607 RepID=UPI003F8D4AB7
MNFTTAFAAPEYALSHWLPPGLVHAALGTCRGLRPSPTTAHPAWNGLLAALGLATARPRKHPLPQVHLVEVRLTTAEHALLATVAGLVPELAHVLREEQ